MRRFTTILALVCMALSAQGCTMFAVKAMDEVDRAISKVAQADCELVRITHGMDICRTPPPEVAAEPVYCYRRLGGVDCYTRRDPLDHAIVPEHEDPPIQTSDATTY